MVRSIAVYVVEIVHEEFVDTYLSFAHLLVGEYASTMMIMADRRLMRNDAQK